MMKVLAVVSGGDAPGINTALWQFARLCAGAGIDLVGADGGLPAAVHGPYLPLTPRTLAAHSALGGSFLASSRDPVLRDAGGQAALAARLHGEGIDAVLLFGGDGTLTHIPPVLAALGAACIALPTTIDNDIPGTQYTLGFDTACNFGYHSIDGALATGRALPGRIFTVETLGGFTGHLALAIGHGAGAHAVLVPEIGFEMSWLAGRVTRALAADGHALIVHSEGIPESRTLPDALAAATGVRVRDVRLGHAQRGGSPSHTDRAWAAAMAQAAFVALRDGVQRGVLCINAGQLTLYEGDMTALPRRTCDEGIYRRINGLEAVS